MYSQVGFTRAFHKVSKLGFSEDRFSSLRSARPWNRADLRSRKTNFSIPCGLDGLRSHKAKVSKALESQRPYFLKKSFQK